MTIQECYDTLGVNVGCSEADLKKAYRKRCFETHPDRNNGQDAEFKKIQEAYNALTGKSKTTSNPDPNNFYGSQYDAGDLRKAYEDFMNNMFRNMRGYGGFSPNMPPKSAARPPERDADINVDIRLTVEQIKKGGILKVNYQKSKTCTKCMGVGGKERNSCSTCNGKGMVDETKKDANSFMSWKIPCTICNGSGIQIKEPCKECGTVGFIVYTEHLEFSIREKQK